MPHIVVEYSRNLEDIVRAGKVLELAHQIVLECGLFDPGAVKARGMAYDQYVLPEGRERFLHITLSILSGRPLEARQALSDALFRMANEAAPDADSLTVNLHEMDPDTYRK